jgi:hypothetical protein
MSLTKIFQSLLNNNYVRENCITRSSIIATLTRYYKGDQSRRIRLKVIILYIHVYIYICTFRDLHNRHVLEPQACSTEPRAKKKKLNNQRY